MGGKQRANIAASDCQQDYRTILDEEGTGKAYRKTKN